MKALYKTAYVLCTILLISFFSFSKVKSQMETSPDKNKEAIRNLYENILNKRQFEQLDNLISKDYVNLKGDKGVEGFKKQIPELIKAFPDAQWTLTAIVAEGNKVFVKQRMQGTHKGAFQHIAPTNKFIINEGTGFYEFKDGKIIYHEIQTDRLGFLQQLGVIPVEH
jgi:predicted ester cyclase